MLRSLFSRPKVEFFTFNPTDRSILFHSEKPMEPGRSKVSAQVAGNTLKCEIALESTEGGLHFGYFLSPEDALEPLSVLLPQPKIEEDKRAHERLGRILRVCSAHPPHFQAYTEDLSMGGMKLRTQGELKAGEFLECQVEFDDAMVARINVECTVRWCRKAEEGWDVGLEFCGLSPDTKSRLAWFLKAITEVEQGVLTTAYAVFD